MIQNELRHQSNIIKRNLIVASKQHSLRTSPWKEKRKHAEVIASNGPWL